MKKISSSVYLANSILEAAKAKNIKINCVKLNNLIYLVYTDYLYHTQTALFDEQFSLTHKGPILPSIYFEFNCYGDEEIKNYASDAKGNIYTLHNESLDSIINYNLDLHGYSYVDELIEISKRRINSRQYLQDNNMKNYNEKAKVYALQLKKVESKKRS